MVRDRSAPGSRMLIAINAAAVTAAFVLVALVPGEGQAALYLPLAPAGPGSPAGWAVNRGASLLANGPVAGSVLLRVPPGGLTLAALARPGLLIAVPAPLCGPAAARPTG